MPCQPQTCRTGDNPVDELPPLSRLLPLALLHVPVMYAGAVTVPLVVGRALGPARSAPVLLGLVFGGEPER